MKNLLLGALLVIVCTSLFGAGTNDITIGQEVRLKSQILQEERSVLVYLPATYTLSSASYPVMYLLDGGTHFHHVTGIVQFLSSQGLIPEMIVIAVNNVDRTRDFSPTQLTSQSNTGGAEKFMGFLSEELIPYVNAGYRTEPYKLLVGHSLGGAFATYALLSKPEVFNAYIAISPYLMYDYNYLVRKTIDDLRPNYDNRWFYMTLGDEPDYVEALDKVSQVMGEKSPTGLDFIYVPMKDENHGSIPHLSIYRGLEYIFNGYQLTDENFRKGLSAIDKHYKLLSKKYGYKVETPELVVNLLGYTYMREGDTDRAIKVFMENVKRYPKSSNVYDSLGEALETNEQFAQAVTNYQKAVDIAGEGDEPNLAIYKSNLERAKTQVAMGK